MVSGVDRAMLEANPRLNYRDVQEILMRGAYVDPTNEGWETNLFESFQDPSGFGLPLEDPFARVDHPTNAVALQSPGGFGFPSNIMLKPIDDYTFQSLPQFTNGAGYSVSYARGIFQEETGWAHGVVDADLAVRLAEQWHKRGQDNRPEVTYTSFRRFWAERWACSTRRNTPARKRIRSCSSFPAVSATAIASSALL